MGEEQPRATRQRVGLVGAQSGDLPSQIRPVERGERLGAGAQGRGLRFGPSDEVVVIERACGAMERCVDHRIIISLKAEEIANRRSSDDDAAYSPEREYRPYRNLEERARGAHPDPVRAARAVIAAGSDGITCHLREDRRHIRDEDARAIKGAIDAPLYFEMAATEEMRAFALDLKPDVACIVPERREEVTTEGGLDLAADPNGLARLIEDLTSAGIRVSLFIDPEPTAVATAARLGASIVELHTGAYCHAPSDVEFNRLRAAAAACAEHGIELHAGHGLDFDTVRAVATLPGLHELSIGHFLMGEAAFVGLDAAVTRMRAAIDEAAAA